VFLEGLAAGCRVIASKVGGVPEAGGDLIRYVPPGDSLALARALEAELGAESQPGLCQRRRDHLARFRAATVAERYLAVIADLMS
jgi:glycosyltransferase involved in cell wall biosynthesis